MIQRADALAALQSDSFDVIVVGPASRGYGVALAEKLDFAAGTASRSSKLVHRGLRHLQSFGGKRPDRLTGVGLNLYDVMACWRGRDEDEGWSTERHRTVDCAETVEMVPAPEEAA